MGHATWELRHDKSLTIEQKWFYVIIDAHTQERGYCWGTNAYFSALVGKSERTISGWIKALESAGHITTGITKTPTGTERHIRLRSAYSPPLEADCTPSNKTAGGSQPIAEGVEIGCYTPYKEELYTENKKENKDNCCDPAFTSDKKKEKKVFTEDSVEYKIAVGLYSKIKSINEDLKEPNFQKWASDIDLIIRIDKKTPQEVCEKIRAVEADGFWSTVILSPSKLRAKWNEGKLAHLIDPTSEEY
jgi:hypothetical protein